MSLFKRLFTLGKAEANAVVDKLEDPIKMTEQGIRDMKKDLEDSLKALAEVKALEIRSKNDIAAETERALDYEKKAVLLLQKAANGKITSEEADRLASQALQKKTESEGHLERAKKEQALFSQNVSKLEGNVKELRNNINSWENELKTLKARVKVASATKNLNKQISEIDSSNTISLLEKMKDKVAEEEALSDAYGSIASKGKSIDDEIDNVLKDDPGNKISDSLAELKAKIASNKKDA
ncbi:phage shock protein A (PspA) family protein [Aquimarina sp. MAR_2010_214]|uniref:PspA/IM30 family protein n=1 Tax=Aquimarina sp. MAR_2010_214 TaxID=1250026 RepID=UPI000C7021A6|nr:PspA/IM30 family protein [Aquimarina sp. MAR_2010_214]PKV48033.1 phage shock protein A (PspA) family protein [Aquimarina sp. MAR_2010_214]